MKLITVEEAVAALGVRDLTDLRDTLSFLLDRVTLSLQSLLETDFSYGAGRQDVYRLGAGDVIESQTSLLMILSRALITSATGEIEIRTAPTYSMLADATPIQTIPMVDRHRGHISIIDEGSLFIGGFLSVKYSYGMQAHEDDPNLYVGVPQWLRDITGAYIFEAYHAHKTMNTDSGRTAYKSVSGMRLPKIVPSTVPPPSPGIETMIAPYKRFTSVGLRPIGSIDG